MKYLTIFGLIVLTGCVSTPPEPSQDLHFSSPPHLWSGQKIIGYPPESCAKKAVGILEVLSFTSVVRNGNYVYGNFSGNRAAIKCVPNGDETFAYAAVAGPEKEEVEHLRNEIVWRL